MPTWLATLHFALGYCSLYGAMVPLAVGLWRWHKLSAPARIVVGYFAFWSVEAFVDTWSKQVLHTNMYLYHVTVLVETWLLGWAYYTVLHSHRVRRFILPAGLVFTIVALLDAFVWSGLHQFNDYARALQVVLLLALVLLYFEQWLQDLRAANPWYDFMFVVSVALAVYHTGSLMSYLLLTVEKSKTIEYQLGIIINLTSTALMVLMTMALWRDGRKQQANYPQTEVS